MNNVHTNWDAVDDTNEQMWWLISNPRILDNQTCNLLVFSLNIQQSLCWLSLKERKRERKTKSHFMYKKACSNKPDTINALLLHFRAAGTNSCLVSSNGIFGYFFFPGENRICFINPTDHHKTLKSTVQTFRALFKWATQAACVTSCFSSSPIP